MADENPSITIPANSQPLILALDIGSSSSRAALFDCRGQRLPDSLVHATYDGSTIESRHGALNPEPLASAVEGLIDRLLAELDDGVAIEGVAVSTFWHSIMGIDESGLPVTEVLMWSDIRSAQDCATLEARLDADAYYRRTGTPVHSSYPATKILWLQRERPDAFGRVRRLLSFGEYLYQRFFGDATVSISMASASGLFDQERLDWDSTVLEAINIDPQRLSPISDDAATGLLRQYAERWPALKGARWIPALGDGACANVGSGAIGTQRIALSVGTSGAMRMLWEGKPVEPPAGLWLYRLDAKRLLLGGALSEGGNLWEWISKNLHLSPRDTLGARVAAILPDSHGLTWLPFLAGERSVGWSPDARGVITGLTLRTTPEEILRAALEAISYRFGLIAKLLEPHVDDDRIIIGSGNALVNDRNWAQMICDVIDWDLIVSQEPEASLRGAALVALERLGELDGLESAAGSVLEGARRHTPDKERHEIYLNGLQRQQELYRRLLG